MTAKADGAGRQDDGRWATEHEHSWRFDGDDPYVICVICGEMRDALTGRIVREADRG